MNLLESNPQLLTGEMRADATMTAGAEGHVSIVRAVQAHRCGIVEHRLVAIGRTQHQEQLITGLDLHPAELDVLRRAAARGYSGFDAEALIGLLITTDVTSAASSSG